MTDITAQAFRQAASHQQTAATYFEEHEMLMAADIHRHSAALLLAAAEQRETLDREHGEREALQRHFDIHVQQASENIDDFLSKIEELTAENEALKAGIRGDIGGGNSLPDFWTAERQLPYVATALNKAKAQIATLTARIDELEGKTDASLPR